MTFKDEINKNKSKPTKAMERQATTLSKRIPTQYLTDKEQEVLEHYTGNLWQAVQSTFKTMPKNMVAIRCSTLMKNPHFNKSVNLMNDTYEKYGLLSALELRKTLEKMIESKKTSDGNKLKAISLLMTTKGMLESKLVVEQNSTNTKRRELIINITGGGAMSIPIEHCKQTLIG